jgi:hypothetical protein
MRAFDVPFGRENRYYFALTQGPVRFVCLDCGEDNLYPVLIGGGPAMAGREAGTVIVLEANRKELRARTVSVNGKMLFEYRTPRSPVENR